MTHAPDPVTGFVVLVFGAPAAALFLAAAILLFAVGVIIRSHLKAHGPLMAALRDRWNLLTELGGRSRAQAFFEAFSKIDLRFSSLSGDDSVPAALLLGWANYRSLLVDSENGHFITSIRAAEAFDRLDEPARALEWWANILVAIGLMITFLGIVAALSQATSSISAGAAQAQTQTALMGLLAIAATKFWTSIAGVLASIVLRIVARFRRRAIERAEADLFVALDSCVGFMPPEKVSLEQLKSLHRLEQAVLPMGH